MAMENSRDGRDAARAAGAAARSRRRGWWLWRQVCAPGKGTSEGVGQGQRDCRVAAVPRASQEVNKRGGTKLMHFLITNSLLFLKSAAVSTRSGNSTPLEAQHPADSAESSKGVYTSNSK